MKLWLAAEKRKPAMGGFSVSRDEAALFDLGFLVHHVLTYRGIEFLDLHLAGLITLVFRRGVEMSGTRAGDQSDFVTHDPFPPLNFLAASAQVAQYAIDTFLIDDAHTLGGETQAHPAVLALNPEFMGVQIGQEASFGFVVCMGNVVSRNRAFTGYLADSRHGRDLK
jgi:hypothetical protein